MARKILHERYSESANYTLIGISCHLKDYRLSYLLNNKLEFVFSKQQDLAISIQGNKEPANFSFYFYKDEDQATSYLLVANRSEDHVLLPEIKQLDFLLLLEGEFKKSRKDQVIKAVGSIPNVLTAYEISPGSIRNSGNLFSEIEIHLMNISRKPKSKFETNLKQ
jgi:hypothetical protein